VVKEDAEHGKDDIRIWKEGESGRYTVKSAYTLLRIAI